MIDIIGRSGKVDSRLCRRSGLRAALRASVGAARLGADFRPLPPEGIWTVIIRIRYQYDDKNHKKKIDQYG